MDQRIEKRSRAILHARVTNGREERKGRMEILPTFTLGIPIRTRRYLSSHLRVNLTATNCRPRNRKWIANRRIKIYCTNVTAHNLSYNSIHMLQIYSGMDFLHMICAVLVY